MTSTLRRVALVHLGANALLLGLGYYWLGLAESRASALAWSLFVAIVFVSAAFWTYGAALACREANPWRTALRNLLPLLAGGIVLALLYGLLSWLNAWSINPASTIASWLTLKLRKPVRPQSSWRVFQTIVWLLWWVVVPVFAIPVLSSAARLGWRGLHPRMPSRWEWLITPILLLLGLWAPLKLLAWVPRPGGFGMEAISFGLRALIAYLLFAASLLLLAFRTSDGNPRPTQPSTAVSP